MREDNKKYNLLIPGGLLVILMVTVFVLINKQSKEDKVLETNDTGQIPAFAVQVQTEYYTGQGVVYVQEENAAYILTTHHLLEGMETGEFCNITLHDQRQIQALYIYGSETADVAFLMAEETRLDSVPKDREKFDALKEESVIAACNFSGNAVQLREGRIVSPWVYLEDFSLDMMLVQLEAEAGMSGCAILDGEGYFAGILCGISETGEAAVVPFSVIESEWIMTGR